MQKTTAMHKLQPASWLPASSLSHKPQVQVHSPESSRPRPGPTRLCLAKQLCCRSSSRACLCSARGDSSSCNCLEGLPGSPALATGPASRLASSSCTESFNQVRSQFREELYCSPWWHKWQGRPANWHSRVSEGRNPLTPGAPSMCQASHPMGPQIPIHLGKEEREPVAGSLP